MEVLSPRAHRRFGWAVVLLVAIGLLVIGFSHASCVTPDNLHDVAAAQQVAEDRTTAALEQLNAGTITADEFKTTVNAIKADLAAALKKVKDDVAAQTAGFVTEGQAMAQTGGTNILAMLLLNAFRNKTRRKALDELGSPESA